MIGVPVVVVVSVVVSLVVLGAASADETSKATPANARNAATMNARHCGFMDDNDDDDDDDERVLFRCRRRGCILAVLRC